MHGAPGWQLRTNAEPRARRRAREREIRHLEQYLRHATVTIYAEVVAIVVALLLITVVATVMIQHGR
jgi:hypothetical protein